MTTAEALRSLEELLLRPDGRDLTDTIGEGFQEIGASGKVYDRTATLAVLASRIAEPFSTVVEDFSARSISTDVVLVTYTLKRIDTEGRPHASLRSSLWQQRDGRWHIVFHQGTYCPAP